MCSCSRRVPHEWRQNGGGSPWFFPLVDESGLHGVFTSRLLSWGVVHFIEAQAHFSPPRHLDHFETCNLDGFYYIDTKVDLFNLHAKRQLKVQATWVEVTVCVCVWGED